MNIKKCRKFVIRFVVEKKSIKTMQYHQRVGVLICNFNFMSVCKGTIKFQPMYIVYIVRTALFKKLAWVGVGRAFK